ncbi:MAG: FecR domain-containing protein [Prolixibacteraceae bacterium]
MQNRKEIKKLLDRINTGEINSSEKQLLFRFFNDPESRAVVYRWLKKKWKGLQYEEPDTEVDFEKLLLRIHQDVKQDVPTPLPLREQPSKLHRIIRVSMRYAAVCLIACGLEWYILTQTGGNENAQKIVYNQVDVPHGSRSFIVLADSTLVWLNAGAKLRYPADFNGSNREVFLDGEAFFDVTKDKHRPFLVKVSGMDLKVHGTKFNVKAYNDEYSIETTLLEGSVEVIGLKAREKDSRNLFMKPGQKLILYKEKKNTSDSGSENKSEDAESVKIADARLINLSATDQEVAWKHDKLVFDKQRFDEVKTRLERWYGVTIEIRDSSVLDYRFSGTFDKETFEQAMYALKEAADFEYVLSKKHVVIKP